MKTKIKRVWLCAIMMCVFIGFASCGDDGVEPNGGKTPGKNAEQNTTDVAVTGSVSEVGNCGAQINGVVNFEVIMGSYTNVTIGVEVSATEDFKEKERTEASDVVGRKFSVLVIPLRPDTKYYYRTYVSVSSLSYDYYGETYSFVTTSLDNANHYVNLGFPSGTLWATMNVGASKPEDYGSYFAWGETTTKSDYSSTTYKGNPSELPTGADAAYVNWGSNWRMPSLAQFEELISNTATTWTTLNGVDGILIASRINGNGIFLPAAGGYNGSSLYDGGSVGRYWSRTLSASGPRYACYLYFNSSVIYTGNGYRYCGLSVRPVRLSEQ